MYRRRKKTHISQSQYASIIVNPEPARKNIADN